MPRSFVIHEHFATHHHYDLRLENNGVLVSWAVPKGVPPQVGEKRLAVQVDNHALSYLKFEGNIPDGEYGAGKVTIWDSGTYEPVSWGGGKIVVKFHGNLIEGKYVLVRTPKSGIDNWVIFKVDGK